MISATKNSNLLFFNYTYSFENIYYNIREPI